MANDRRSRLYVPDLDEYERVRVPLYSGCDGCVFRYMPDVRCSAIPCGPHMARSWPVVYQKKGITNKC
jgi:hypothetical protein